MWRSLLVFSAVLGLALAAVGNGPLQPKPDKYKNVEGCYIKELDAMVPFGTSAPSKAGCMEYRCSHGGVGWASCGKVLVTPPCKAVEDLSKPYPECCDAKIVC